jgi:hypothetical protein
MTRKKILVGKIGISLPDENQSYFSIFEDLVELFGKEYQNEAAKILRSKLKDVKPKPSIDYESDYTHITTSNVDTLIAVIDSIIELTIDDYKNAFQEVNKAELNKIFTDAKKNRPKPKQWDTGDVFAIPLTEKTFTFGQVLNKKYCTCALFDIHSKNAILPVLEFKKLNPISILHLSNGDLLNNGQWQIIFNQEVTLNPDGGSGGKFGTIGCVSYGQCGVMADLAKAYWGLIPWNVMYDEYYYDKILLKGIKRPNSGIILSHEDRLKYRKEKFGISYK